MTFTQQFLEEAGQIVKKIDTQAVDRLVALLASTRAVQVFLFEHAPLGTAFPPSGSCPEVIGIRRITPEISLIS